MEIIEQFLTKNPCYLVGKIIEVKGLMLHSVGCNQPRASVFINNWNPPADGREICVHGFIDGIDGNVYQTLPWNRRGWHAGGSANNTHIGVEMCEPACIQYTKGANFTCSNLAEAQTVARRTYKSAVELFAYLCKKFKLNPLADGVIISHREGNVRGVASAHGDPEHLWTQLKLEYTMDGFRKDVKAKMDGTSISESIKPSTPKESYYRVRKTWLDDKSQIGAYKILENAKKKVDENPGYKVFDDSGILIYPKSVQPSKSVSVAKSKDKNLSGSYRVSANGGLNLRYEPGKLTADNVVSVIPTNAVVRNYGYYTEVNGTKWLYVVYRDMIGFVNSSYLRKL